MDGGGEFGVVVVIESPITWQDSEQLIPCQGVQ